jgi:large subunit ribosomal protein L9
MKDMEKLGDVGDEIEVSDGYARNYLIPKKVAIRATKGALKVVEQKKKEKERRLQKEKQEAAELAEKMTDLSCTITVEAGEEDKLFGAVTSEMIAEALAAEGVEVDKKKVSLEEPIKALGVYNVDIKLHPEVKAQARIWVVKK